jgi:transposase
MYWINGSGPKMILVLDNAPYHHKEKTGGVNINALNKFRPSQAQKDKNNEDTLISVAKRLEVPSLTVMRDGVPMEFKADEFDKKGKGALSVNEFKVSLHAWVKCHKPELLETELQSIFSKECFQLIYSPPYSPKFQPIELLWRDSKNFVAREYTIKRTPDDTANDLMDFWFGCETSRSRKKEQTRYSPQQAGRIIHEARIEINNWIGKCGLRLSDQLGDLIYDPTKAYPEDGSLLEADRELEDSIESDEDDENTIDRASTAITTDYI